MNQDTPVPSFPVSKEVPVPALFNWTDRVHTLEVDNVKCKDEIDNLMSVILALQNRLNNHVDLSKKKNVEKTDF